MAVLYSWRCGQHGQEGLGGLTMLLTIAVYYLNRYMGMERTVYQRSARMLYLASGGVFVRKCSGSRCTQITGFKKFIVKAYDKCFGR